LFKIGVYHLECYGASIVVTKHNPAWAIAGCAIHDSRKKNSLVGLTPSPAAIVESNPLEHLSILVLTLLRKHPFKIPTVPPGRLNHKTTQYPSAEPRHMIVSILTRPVCFWLLPRTSLYVSQPRNTPAIFRFNPHHKYARPRSLRSNTLGYIRSILATSKHTHRQKYMIYLMQYHNERNSRVDIRNGAFVIVGIA
jgi:hypothetical protein